MADPKIAVESPGEDRPLKSLTPTDLALVAEQVPYRGGNVDVYRHYLPRILDIAITEDFDWPDFEAVMSHLAYTPRLDSIQWTEWPEHEQNALRMLFDSVWSEILTVGLDLLSADDFLCGLSNAAVDLSPFLERWARFTDPMSAQQLLWFLEDNPQLTDGRVRNAFWSVDKPWEASNKRLLVRWANSEQLKSQVQLALKDPSSEDEANALTGCLALLSGEDRFAPTALEVSVQLGDLDEATKLLSTGSVANSVDEIVGTRLWELAFEFGHYRICHAFVDAGASLEATAENGDTFLNRLVSSEATPSRFIKRYCLVPIQWEGLSVIGHHFTMLRHQAPCDRLRSTNIGAWHDLFGPGQYPSHC
jgi:hypothetical protein